MCPEQFPSAQLFFILLFYFFAIFILFFVLKSDRIFRERVYE